MEIDRISAEALERLEYGEHPFSEEQAGLIRDLLENAPLVAGIVDEYREAREREEMRMFYEEARRFFLLGAFLLARRSEPPIPSEGEAIRRILGRAGRLRHRPVLLPVPEGAPPFDAACAALVVIERATGRPLPGERRIRQLIAPTV